MGLSREFLPDVFENPNSYPVLSVKNRFIVPGGFFQVYFYWDSYWILKGIICILIILIKGLIFSNLMETAYGILENFAEIINFRKYIPNSGNIQLSLFNIILFKVIKT